MGVMAGVAGSAMLAGSESAQAADAAPLKGRLKQSVCRWCFSKMELEELCRNAARIGLKSVELLDVDEFAF